jgi:hypothetical protein
MQLGNSQVRTTFLSDIADLRERVGFLFDECTRYSGIINLPSNEVADGKVVEENCYALGGFKYLYKRDDSEICEDAPAREEVSALLNGVARTYARQFTDIIDEFNYLDVAWAVCQREGDYGTIHNHFPDGSDRERRLSGMLYLSCPPSINANTFPNGCLHLICNDNVMYVPPIPGQVVVWPAWMLHGIHPFRGSGSRLGIAFDFNLPVEP